MRYLSTTFQGSNGPGGVSAPGILAGDRVLNVVRLDVAGQGFVSSFGAFAPADATLFQTSASDLSAQSFLASVERPE